MRLEDLEGPSPYEIETAHKVLAQDLVFDIAGHLKDDDIEPNRAEFKFWLDNHCETNCVPEEVVSEAVRIIESLEIPPVSVAPKVEKKPFETPVYLSDATMLCGADHELICRLDSIEPEEANYLVVLVNVGAEAVRERNR